MRSSHGDLSMVTYMSYAFGNIYWPTPILIWRLSKSSAVLQLVGKPRPTSTRSIKAFYLRSGFMCFEFQNHRSINIHSYASVLLAMPQWDAATVYRDTILASLFHVIDFFCVKKVFVFVYFHGNVKCPLFGNCKLMVWTVEACFCWLVSHTKGSQRISSLSRRFISFVAWKVLSTGFYSFNQTALTVWSTLFGDDRGFKYR